MLLLILSFGFVLLTCVQVSLTYDNELEDLQVVLWKAKGQSNQEIGDTNDVFINTYLIPDLRCVSC